jgi:hypothetical protein
MPALLYILLAALLVLPNRLGAQTGGADLFVTGGIFRPMQPFPSVPDSEFPTAAYLEGRGPAIGVGGQWQPSSLPVALRFSWLHARPALRRTQPDHHGDWATAATVNMLLADAVIRGPKAAVLQPHLLVGAGVKRYRFGFSPEDEHGPSWLGVRSTDGTVRVGAGADLSFGRYGFQIEASNYMSRFATRSPDGAPEGHRDSAEIQHDLVYTAGLRVRLF